MTQVLPKGAEGGGPKGGVRGKEGASFAERNEKELLGTGGRQH